MTGTLARMRLKIGGGGAALLAALAAVVLMSAQPAGAQTKVATGTLVSGQTAYCILEQGAGAYHTCKVTVPGSGEITLSDPNPNTPGIVQYTPVINPVERTVLFARSNIDKTVTTDTGTAVWTITNTPDGAAAVTYMVSVTTYESGTRPDGTNVGLTVTGGSAPPAPAQSGGNSGGQQSGDSSQTTTTATPDPKASMTIKFRNDSDGIVRPGQDVELVVETTDVSTSQMTKVTKVTLQGLNLYAKVVTGSGATATTALTLLGSQAGAAPFPGEDSISLTQALKPTAHATGSGATKKTYTIEISVPAGTPDGDYVVTASGNDGKSTDPGALSAPNAKLTVSSTLAGVSTVTFAPSAPRRTKTATETDASPTGGDGYADDASLSESTTIAAKTGSVEFTLSILNAANQAAEADDVASIFITTTGGTLTTSYALMTGPNKAAATDRNMTANCTAGATCQIDLSKLKGGKLLPKGIRVLLNAPATPGAATVRATVVAGGKVHQPEPVTVTFTGPAKSLSIGEPPSTVLGYDVVGKDKDGNDVADDVTKTGHKPEAGAASRDELAFMVQATDGAAGAGSVVKTPTLTVMVHDSAGMLVASGKYQTKQSGALMNMLLLDIDAPKATPLKPGEYKLTLSSTSPALKAERMFTVVGDGSTLALELAPMSADTFGQTVTATATVEDASGNPVAAGTAVTFKVSDFSGGNDAVAVLDTEGAVLTNKDGVASAALTVVGAGNAVVRATTAKAGGGSLLKTAVLVSRAGAPADAGGEAGLDCLSELSGFAVWTCAGSTASALFELLSARGATAIHLWNGSVWVRYSVVDGTMVPGSRDFTVGESDIIYISN